MKMTRGKLYTINQSGVYDHQFQSSFFLASYLCVCVRSAIELSVNVLFFDLTGTKTKIIFRNEIIIMELVRLVRKIL